MSQNQLQTGSSGVPVNEVYWALVAKADKKFSKIRDLPYYQRTRYDTYFYKVFKVYTQLWKFQQENRQKLVEAGLKRWEIGEIASRIGQLYFGQYMRTSEASYLSESYIFYEAILTREYFKEGLHQDVNLASKQLRFFARFLTVCLLLNRREMVYQLVNQLKMLLDECKRTFQDTCHLLDGIFIECSAYAYIKNLLHISEWQLSKYLAAVIRLSPTCYAKRKLRLRDALLCSYHPNEDATKFGVEPSGSFYQASMASSSGTGSGASQNGASGPSRVNQDITDPTLPPNPRKAILFRPSVTHFMAVLGTVCEELPSDGILLLYLSASGNSSNPMSSPSRTGTSIGYSENIIRGFQFPSINSDSSSTYPVTTGYDSPDHSGCTADCLHIGPRGHGDLDGEGIVDAKEIKAVGFYFVFEKVMEGRAKLAWNWCHWFSNKICMNCIYPSDLLPFTRRPLFVVIDSESSKAFKAMSGAEKGETVALLLSPATSLPLPAVESCRLPSGSLFTSFLTAPLQSFILLLGFTGSDIEKDLYSKAENLLQSSLNKLGSSLAAADNLDPVWAQILPDPFLRRLLLRNLLD
ncbi:UNVERIFIED_CONTAM: protein SCAI [Sesamum latifolium]|uniref:Protein SCAI n=1 Tax=Sesamum latifolium TaxID=2727402 RepID=A0AAW2U1B0_9LAMI